MQFSPDGAILYAVGPAEIGNQPALSVVSNPTAATTTITAHAGPRNAAEFNENVPLFTHPIPGALWSDLKTAGLVRQDAPVPK